VRLLGVAFGLIPSEVVGTLILVKKNVRVACNHCHRAALKVGIEVIDAREIIVGGTKIIHVFSDGPCCCGDYW
jgi:hypothetical protein